MYGLGEIILSVLASVFVLVGYVVGHLVAEWRERKRYERLAKPTPIPPASPTT